MKKILMILVFLFAIQVSASQKQFGIGFGGGNVISGLSAKYNMGGDTGLVGTLGTLAGNGFGLGLDFIMILPPDLVKNSDVRLFWYAGAGGSFLHYSWDTGYDNDYSWNVIGVNGIVGIGLMLQKVPLEFTLDVRPGFYILLENNDFNDNNGFSGFGIGFGGSVRWFF
jgi:hypothetical protein